LIVRGRCSCKCRTARATVSSPTFTCPGARAALTRSLCARSSRIIGGSATSSASTGCVLLAALYLLLSTFCLLLSRLERINGVCGACCSLRVVCCSLVVALYLLRVALSLRAHQRGMYFLLPFTCCLMVSTCCLLLSVCVLLVATYLLLTRSRTCCSLCLSRTFSLPFAVMSFLLSAPPYAFFFSSCSPIFTANLAHTL